MSGVTSNHSQPSDSSDRTTVRPVTGANRRQFLAVLGAGTTLATAGCLAAGDDETDDTNTDPEIDARFGYTVLPDEETTLEADHTVQLLLRPREDVPIPEFFFEPTGLYVEQGDTVKFEISTPHHNVNAHHPAFGYTQRVPDDVPPFSSPVLTAGDAWYYTFEHEGVHDIMCAPHEIFGMVGRIVVGSVTGPGAEPVGEAPGPEQARPPEFTAGLVLADPALEPEAIVDSGAVSWDDLDPESKRLMVHPADE